MDRLVVYDWPGNVRELENLIELMINTERLPPLPSSRTTTQIPAHRAEPARVGTLGEAELERIREALEQCGNNVSCAARLLGIGRNTIYRKMHLLDRSVRVEG